MCLWRFWTRRAEAHRERLRGVSHSSSSGAFHKQLSKVMSTGTVVDTNDTIQQRAYEREEKGSWFKHRALILMYKTFSNKCRIIRITHKKLTTCRSEKNTWLETEHQIWQTSWPHDSNHSTSFRCFYRFLSHSSTHILAIKHTHKMLLLCTGFFQSLEETLCASRLLKFKQKSQIVL